MIKGVNMAEDLPDEHKIAKSKQKEESNENLSLGGFKFNLPICSSK